MKVNTVNTIGRFLKLNGFIDTEPCAFANEHCGVVVSDEGFEIADNEGGTMYLQGHLIYQLIGYLTYSGYMDKNYKQ